MWKTASLTMIGCDWVKENNSDVEIVADLVYSRASNCISKWVLAVPETSDIISVKDLQGKKIIQNWCR